MTSGPFFGEAPAYWEAGLPILPTEPKSKRPAVEIRGWQGYVGGVPSPTKRSEWLSKYPDRGIALLLGAEIADGLLIGAVDVDMDDYLRVTRAILGPCPCAKRGKKGATFFVAVPKSARLKSSQVKDPEGKGAIDVLLGGRITILPPTLHPDTGKPYEWIGEPLLDCEIGELPIFDEYESKLLRNAVGSPHALTLMSGETTHDAGLSLVAGLVATGATDEEIAAIVEALLPEKYAGNSLEELHGWIAGAREKGFDKAVKIPLDDAVARIVEAELAPLVYVEGDGFLRYEDGYWQAVFDNDVDRRSKQILSETIQPNRQVQPLLRSVRVCLALNTERKKFGEPTGRICVLNGTINVLTGEIEPHTPDHELRFRLDIEYDAEATCPTYEDQVQRTFCGAEKVVGLFDEFAGLTLVPDMRYQKALYLVGEGGSGKSTLLKVVETMHDARAISVTPLVKIEDERYLTDLARKLVCISFDVQTNKKVFGEHFVRITGGDPVSTRKLYHEVEGRVVPTVRFLGSMNPDMPTFIAAPDALARRLMFLACSKKIEDPDPDRFEKLRAERPGILARWVRALKRLTERGSFDIPESSELEVDDYLSSRDGFDLYAAERLVADARAKTPVSEITSDFNFWAQQMGEASLQPHVVGRKLRRIGIDGGFAKSGEGDARRTTRVVFARIRQSFRGDI